MKNSGAVVHELVVLQADVPQDELAADAAFATSALLSSSAPAAWIRARSR